MFSQRPTMRTEASQIPGLEAARLAPSAHNTQPWLFERVDGKINVKWNPDRELPAGDPHSLYLMTGLGASVEAMILGATQNGLQSEVTFDISMTERRAAVVNFSPSPVSSADLELAEAVSHRQTTRLPFRTDPVPADALTALVREADKNGCSLAVLSDRHMINRLSRVHAEATRLNLENTEVYEEFFNWLRLSRSDYRYLRDGLNLESLSLDVIQSTFAAWTMPPSRFRGVKALQLHRLIIGAGQGKLARRSSAICLLTAASHSLHDVFLGGRIMMRVWLAMTNLGLRVHPITAMLDNDETRAELVSLFGIDHKMAMVVCFRIGFGPSGPRSPRLPIEELLIT